VACLGVCAVVVVGSGVLGRLSCLCTGVVVSCLLPGADCSRLGQCMRDNRSLCFETV
jgi:hypothetical protein